MNDKIGCFELSNFAWFQTSVGILYNPFVNVVSTLVMVLQSKDTKIQAKHVC